ncbi:hypothetical protein T069G_08659 [Trichoderma breve]|uniref:Uncharacterized protein n=1 Tax=Trichoderma breve TaxID=2034170 RepID=A0A9W9B881_9HYPO|nr:hypothetical protein T069G_08659 [Trichoderma breve]KAJ4857762.1 hypothetical protein T069G_08659 [Trichoderma breve]
MNYINALIAYGNLPAETPCVSTGSLVSYERLQVILSLIRRHEEGNEEPVINVQASTEDTSPLEMLHRLTGTDGELMVAAKPTLSMSLALSPFTLGALTTNSNPLNYSCFVSDQGSRGLYFQAFETERFEFLLNFTLCGGLDISFNFLTSSEKVPGNAYFDNFLTIDDLLSIDYEAGSKWVKASEERSRATKTMEWLFDPLLSQTKAICEKLLNLPGIDKLVTGNHLQSLDEQCLEFFNPLNLRACVSKYPNDAQNARKWLEPVERLVFALPWLSRETQGSQADPTLTRYTKLRILQTTVLMCALQTWEGTEKAKERIRKLRYPYVAQASQELAYHRPDEQIGSDLAATLRHWDEFIFEEQILRTKTYVFLLDTAFTIFHMTPPRITVPDLDLRSWGIYLDFSDTFHHILPTDLLFLFTEYDYATFQFFRQMAVIVE